MTKVLLSNRNSVWGVIINPQSSNTYRHVLSFATPELKDAFINKELFGGQDYKVLIEQQPETKFVQQTSINAVWRINPDDYNETTANLLNKDFAIVKENGKFLYYAITSAKKIAPKTIEFTGELDIFFQYDVKEMFNDKPVMIERAMIDRYYKSGTKLIPNLSKDKSKFNTLDTELLFEEPIQVSDENLIAKNKVETMRENIDHLLKTSMSEADKEFCRIHVNKMKMFVLHRSINNDGKANNLTLLGSDHIQARFVRDDNVGNWMGYVSVLGIAGQTETPSKEGRPIITWIITTDNAFNVDFTKPDPQKCNYVSGIAKNHLEEADTIPNSYSISPYTIFNYFTGDDTQIEKVGNEIQITTKANKGRYDSRKTIYPAQYVIGGNKMGHFVLRSSIDKINEIPTSKEFNIKPLPEFLASELNKDSKVNDYKHKFEIKSYFAPFRKLKLKGSSKLEKTLAPQLFAENKLELKYSFSYIPELWNSIAHVKNYNTFLDSSSSDVLEPERYDFFEDIAPYGLPTERNAYIDYMTSHRSQMTAGLFSTATTGALGVIGGMITGNPLAIAGSIGGAIAGINQTLALQSDLQRTPLQLSQTSSTLQRDFGLKQMKPIISEETLSPYMMNHIRQFLYTWGYALNNYQDDINKYLNSRYYFNFLQVPQTFENNKLQASATIKQIINDSFAEGITIWNVRDLATFKGIKNYEYENVEMSLI